MGLAGALLLGLGLLSTSTRADDSDLGAPVTGADALTKLVTGNTVGGTVDGYGDTWAEFFCSTGRTIYAQGDHLDRGKWWVAHGELCFSYDDTDYQEVMCFDTYAKPDGRLAFVSRTPDGHRDLVFRSDPPVHGDRFRLNERTSDGCHANPSA
ncbi:MAG TPA: hypothetical protein VMT54_15020 [Candidatus Cybelea sp.]|nr:hypothetical protein [Candidatus Cybelea sp.]